MGLWLVLASVWPLAGAGLAPHESGTRTDFIQKKLAAVEKFAAGNQAALRRYTWTETVRFLLKDVSRPGRSS